MNGCAKEVRCKEKLKKSSLKKKKSCLRFKKKKKEKKSQAIYKCMSFLDAVIFFAFLRVTVALLNMHAAFVLEMAQRAMEREEAKHMAAYQMLECDFF